MQNNKLRELAENFNDEAWLAFHNGDIDSSDDYYEYYHTWIEDAVIYNHHCVDILEGNWNIYCFDEHDIWGKPENISQAAYACLYDYLQEETDIVQWSDMEDVLNESLQEVKKLADHLDLCYSKEDLISELEGIIKKLKTDTK